MCTAMSSSSSFVTDILVVWPWFSWFSSFSWDTIAQMEMIWSDIILVIKCLQRKITIIITRPYTRALGSWHTHAHPCMHPSDSWSMLYSNSTTFTSPPSILLFLTQSLFFASLEYNNNRNNNVQSPKRRNYFAFKCLLERNRIKFILARDCPSEKQFRYSVFGNFADASMSVPAQRVQTVLDVSRIEFIVLIYLALRI